MKQYPFNQISSYRMKGKFDFLVNYNFCSNVETACTNMQGLVVSRERCHRYAGSAYEEKTWTFDERTKTINIEFPEGDVCERRGDQIIKYKTQFLITCDKNESFKVTNAKVFNPRHCYNSIKVLSKYGCSTGKFQAWWNQFGIPKQAVAAILIIIGLYFLILGNFFKIANSIIINSAILGLILYSFINLFTVMNLSLCMLMGIALALAFAWFESVNAVLLGVVVGYLFGSLFYNLEVKMVQVNPQALYWGTIVICIIIISVAGGFMKDYMVCLATGMVGAYAFVRGISVFAGGYPDETYVMMLIQKGEYTQFGRVFGPMIYLYIGGIFLLTLIGFWTQSLFVGDSPKKGGEEGKSNEVSEKQGNADQNKAQNADNNANLETNAKDDKAGLLENEQNKNKPESGDPPK